MIESPSRTAPGTESAAPEAHPPDAGTLAPPLTQRQEDFSRHYAATGNAAGAARDAGYAAGSARQTGHELLERPAVAARVRAVRSVWRAVEREEAQILLGRLEQAWDAAVEKGSASLMLRVIKLQADLSGLDRRQAHRRAGLWPLPGEVPGEDALPDAGESGAAGPIAEAVRRGRHRTERALAAHRASRKALERRRDFDEAAWLATAQRLHATVEERRPRTPVRAAGRPAPAMTNPDISLHGSAHRAADAPVADSVGDSPPGAPGGPTPTEPDISLHGSLHRAGLLPMETAGGASAGGAPALDGRAWFADPHAEMARIKAEGRRFTDLEMLAYRTFVDRYAAKMRTRNADFPDSIQGVKHAGGAGFPQPAGEPGPDERRAEEEEQAFLRYLARTRPPYVTGIAGAYLLAFTCDRPCRGAREAARTDGEHDIS